MIRTQVQLTEEQSTRLKEIARRRHLSIAALVREGVDCIITQDADAGAGMTREQLIDRFLALGERGYSDHTDVSERHDDYLAEIYAQ